MSDLTERIKQRIEKEQEFDNELWETEANKDSQIDKAMHNTRNALYRIIYSIFDEESAKEEEDKVSTELRILQNYITHMTKTYRLRNDNASIVHDILLSRTLTAGRTSCIAKCRELGIDPYGYELESEAINENNTNEL